MPRTIRPADRARNGAREVRQAVHPPPDSIADINKSKEATGNPSSRNGKDGKRGSAA